MTYLENIEKAIAESNLPAREKAHILCDLLGAAAEMHMIMKSQECERAEHEHDRNVEFLKGLGFGGFVWSAGFIVGSIIKKKFNL